MLEMVEVRRSSGEAEQRYDLFSGLLDASHDELDKDAALSDEELIGKYSDLRCCIDSHHVLPGILGNMFIFLLGGHEVGLFPYSCRMPAKTLSADHGTYTMLFIWTTSTFSG